MKQVLATVDGCLRCGEQVGMLKSRAGGMYSVKVGEVMEGGMAVCGVADFHKCDPQKIAAMGASRGQVSFKGIAKLFLSIVQKNHPKRLNIKVTDGESTIEARYRDGKTAVYLTDGEAYGVSKYFGSVDLINGSFRQGRSRTSLADDKLIEKFDNDPVATAVASARITGACSFCSRLLTDSRSIEVGYGPVCADNYGLPWGEEQQIA